MIQPSNDVDYGMRNCYNMEKIVMKMITDGTYAKISAT